MSAYLCDNGHISALALYAARAGLPPNVLPREFAPVEEIAEAIARELYAANCASLADRYGDKEQAPFTYEPPSVVKLANHVQVIKAAHCFEYQASEWRGWDESHARQVLRAVIAHAVMSLPGYEKAMWGWPRTERGRVVNPKNATKADLLATIERLQVELHHANACRQSAWDEASKARAETAEVMYAMGETEAELEELKVKLERLTDVVLDAHPEARGKVHPVTGDGVVEYVTDLLGFRRVSCPSPSR